jgi:catechol 2,3-dioxygenase-like lactoylglutathione lyase family enzyme
MLNQFAFSVVDLRRTEHWLREGFGLLPSGGGRLLFRGPVASYIQGLPHAASACWWLVGRNGWFQLELFQFERPIAKLMPPDRRPCDIGYSRVGLWVADFDATLERLGRLGSAPLDAPRGDRGTRRACVRSPDGVFVEVMEDDPWPRPAGADRERCPTAARSITLSVPDLERSCAFFCGALGLEEANVPLHSPEHEALWGLPGAKARRRVLDAGDVLVEIVQYLDPVGKPWPTGYRISDQGILNIAFGTRSKHDHEEVYRRACEAGARPNGRPLYLPGAGVVYVNDPQAFSVEVLFIGTPEGDRFWGFEPRPIERRPPPDNHRLEQRLRIAAPIDAVWAVVSDHEGMERWSGFDEVALRLPGAPERDGYGAERLLRRRGMGAVVEQVTEWQPPVGYRYRVIEGSPLVCHQGEVRLRDVGGETELAWTIRFRPRIPGTGGLLRTLLQRMLRDMLGQRLKALIEAESGGARISR